MYTEQLQEQIKSYSKELQSVLNPRTDYHQKLVQKGIFLYRQQLVSGIKYSEQKIEARVRDVTPVRVEITFNELTNSECTCPATEICRHQIALFFAVLNPLQNSFVWMQEWKQHWSVNDILSNLQRGSDLMKQTAQNTQDGPENWIARVQDAFYDIHTKQSFAINDWARRTYMRLLRFAPMEREWKPLFQLFSSYQSLLIVGEHANNNQVLDSFVQYMLEEIDEALRGITATASPFAFDEYFQYMRTHSIQLIQVDRPFSNEMLEAYLNIWTILFKNRRERETEFHRLSEQDGLHYTIATIHLALLLEKNDWVLREIQEMDPGAIHFVFTWLKLLKDERPNKRFLQFLPVFLTYFSQSIHQISDVYEQSYLTRRLFNILDSETAAGFDHHLIEKTYLQLLPHSRFQYLTYLLEKEDYRKWVELQTLIGNTLDFVDRPTITSITKKDPGALKPLYFNTVDQLIAARSRDSYKLAVRQLKKLKQLYKKEKRLPDWDMYFEKLLTRTKRLRAFHEECRKGKLIDDQA